VQNERAVMVRRLWWAGAAALLVLVFTPLAGGAKRPGPGALDSTFGGDGKVTTDFGASDLGYGVAVQPDGKVIVAGLTSSSADTSFAIVRYDTDGSFDPTFGAEGTVRTDFTPSSSEGAYSVALQADGKIVVAGGVAIPGSGTDVDFALARYNPNGILDPSFDGDGKVVTDFAAADDGAFSVAVQPDGKIVVAGVSRPAGSGPFDFAVARYNPDGSPDSSFDGDGKTTTPIADGSNDSASDLAIQTDGKIVVGGTYFQLGSGGAVLVRYAADGSLDSSFDGDGKAVLSSVTARIDGLALQSDGKIVTTGQPASGSGNFSVTRFNSNGSLDTTFGSGGTAVAPFDLSASSNAVAIQRDGKIVAGGTGPEGHDFAVARFQPGGSLDTRFGSGGIVQTVLAGLAGSDIGSDLAVAADGKIVLAGSTSSSSSAPVFDFATARYLGIAYCVVPKLKRATIRIARARLANNRCRLGKVRRAYSRVRKGRVIAQSPRPGKRLADGGKVKVVVSRGRRR
jgi:uncharacterized delta-60 repeat protein